MKQEVGRELADLKLAVRIDALKMTLRRSLQLAAQMGATAVELDARNEIHPSQLSDTGLRQLRKILEDLNLRVAALRFPTQRGYDNPSGLDRRVDATKQAMQLAYRMQASVVINAIGSVPDSEQDPRWSTMQSVLDDLGRYGARVGAFLAAETGTEPGEKLAKMIDSSPDAYIAVAFNPGQLIINRFDVRESIAALKDRIQVVCAVDGVLDLAAGRGVYVPIGQGTADFPELIGQLEDTQYRGYYILGRGDSGVHELQQGIEYFRNL